MSALPPDDDEILERASVTPRRRTQDLPASSVDLILYQLSEMKAQMREGFAKMEGRFEKVDARQDRLEDRTASLERFRERVEEREKTEAQAAGTVNARWVPIALTFATVIVTVFLYLISANPHG